MGLAERMNRHRHEWFTDARDNGRQMEISWHRDERVFVISLWQGSICRATFRMPIEQAPDAIGVFADALGVVASAHTPVEMKPTRSPLRSLLEGLRRRLRSERAEVLKLNQTSQEE